MKYSVLSFVLAIGIAAAVGQPKDSEPLSIARQGYLFTGGKYSNDNNPRAMSGQLYVEFQIPSRQTHRWPIVMIHGGGQTGTNFTGTPDGREGWSQFFLRQGYAVYVVDQPGRGRAAYEAELYGPPTQLDLENIQRRFVAPERYNLWPQAQRHYRCGRPVRGSDWEALSSSVRRIPPNWRASTGAWATAPRTARMPA